MPVELTDLKRSNVVMTGAEHVERMRRALNTAYSEVPPEIVEVFGAALDQVADQQVIVAQALTRLIDTESLAEAEVTIAAATSEAQRNALRAARAYGDYQSDEAKAVYGELTRIPANTSDLVAKKKKLDEDFAKAVQLHEQNNIAALEPLLVVSAEYSTWCSDARILIVGSEGIVRSDRRRIQLQYLAIAVAILLGILNIILHYLGK